MGTTEISVAAVTSTVMIVLSVILSLIIAIAALIGFFRRWKRSTVGLCRIVLAVILAAIIVVALGTSLGINDKIAGVVNNEIQAESDDMSQTFVQWISAALYSATIPFVYVVVFVIVAQILRIPAYFISKALKITKQDEFEAKNKITFSEDKTENENDQVEHETYETENTSEDTSPEGTVYPVATDSNPDVTENKGIKILEQIGGALITATSALIVICVFLMPITGLFCTVADGLNEFSVAAKESASPMQIDSSSVDVIVVDGHTIVTEDGVIDTDALDQAMKTTIDPIRKNFFVAASYTAPMKLLYDNITKVKVDNNTVSLSVELRGFFDLASNAVYFITDVEKYGEKQINAADKVAAYVVDSEFHCEIAAEILSSVMQSIEKPADNELLSELISTFENTTKESVAEDVKTIRDVFKSAVKNNVPQTVAKSIDKNDGYLDVFECINSEFLYDLLSSIKNNDDFVGLVSPALNYGSKTLTDSFNAASGDIRAGVDMRELTDEQLKKEAETISSALSNVKAVIISFNDINDDQDNMDVLLNVNVAPLGALIDSCEDSLLLGDGTKDTLVVILRSDALSENGLDGIFGVIANHVEKGENISMEKVLISTKELVKVLADYQNENQTLQELSDSLKTIVSNLDAETAAIANEMIPNINARMIKGGDSVNGTVTQKLMTSFIESLSSEEAKELSANPEEFKKEVEAFDYLFNMVNFSTAGKNYTINDANALIKTIATSKIVTKAIVSAAYDKNGNLTKDAELLKDKVNDSDRNAIVAACANYYQENKSDNKAKNEKMKSNLAAIASIFGEDMAEAVKTW